MDRSVVYKWMKKELVYNASDYLDCGEVLCTKLGEAAADAFDLYDYETHDCEIPQEVWDLAVEASEWYSKLTD